MAGDQIVRRPLRVREQSSRPLDQRLVLRFLRSPTRTLDWAIVS